MSYNNLFAVGIGMGVTGAFAYAAHYNLRGCLITSHCLIREYRDTSREVRLQVNRLSEQAIDETNVRHVYSAVSRHEYTSDMVLNASEREYRILRRAYPLWCNSTLHRLMRRPGRRYHFEDFMDSRPTGQSEAEQILQEMRLGHRHIGQFRASLEAFYPSLKKGSEADTFRGEEIRTAPAPSSPK